MASRKASKSSRKKRRKTAADRERENQIPENEKTDGETGGSSRRTDETWRRKDAIRHILILFFVSRAVLTVIGVAARTFIGPLDNVGNIKRFGIGTGHVWLDIWGAWDTRWYFTIAENWYSPAADAAGYASYAFFPLYPVLMKVFGFPFGNAYIGGIVVSNLALLAASWFLYKLVEEMKDHETGKRAVFFMFLFPTAFLFSSVLTESLFAAVSIASFYFARRGNWLVAGVLGGLGALSRPVGLFLAPLLFLEYMGGGGENSA